MASTVNRGFATVDYSELIRLSDELRKIKEEVAFMRYKPWEWFKRDEAFQRSLMNEISKMIAKEIDQGLMFILYTERPDKVVEMVKRVVEDYLSKWEVDDQIARQIVENVVTKFEFIDKFVRIVSPNIVRGVMDVMVKQSRIASDVLKMLKEEYDALDVLDKEGKS